MNIEKQPTIETLTAKLVPLYKEKVREVLVAALDESVYKVELTQMGFLSLHQLVEKKEKIRDVTTVPYVGDFFNTKEGVMHMLTGGKLSDNTNETYIDVIGYKLTEAWEQVMAEYQGSGDEYDDMDFVKIYANAVDHGIAPHVAPYNMKSIFEVSLI
ncbi:hypothetical protein LMH73_009870 [Vibrio splendidus]|nr:hypothetical protein [Vibrio splendidus]MCC4878462.1 hypothetical protein [Vibrio splendidus]